MERILRFKKQILIGGGIALGLAIASIVGFKVLHSHPQAPEAPKSMAHKPKMEPPEYQPPAPPQRYPD